MNIPEIDEVRRATIRPGDRVILRAAMQIDMATAASAVQRFRQALQLGDDVCVVIIAPGMDVEIVGPADDAPAEGTP